MGISAVVAIAGILLAYSLHLRDRSAADRLLIRFAPIAKVLDAKFYVDEIYQAAIVEPLRRLGQFFYAVDRFIIDGIIFIVRLCHQLGGFAMRLTTQRGYLQGYAAAISWASPPSSFC